MDRMDTMDRIPAVALIVSILSIVSSAYENDFTLYHLVRGFLLAKFGERQRSQK